MTGGFRDELVDGLADDRGRRAAPRGGVDLGIARIICVFDPAVGVPSAHTRAGGLGIEAIAAATPQDRSDHNRHVGIPPGICVVIDRRCCGGRKLPLADKEQGRHHEAGPRRDEHGGDPFDPSPFPPIGLQVSHDIPSPSQPPHEKPRTHLRPLVGSRRDERRLWKSPTCSRHRGRT
jgi:hypothetical protein